MASTVLNVPLTQTAIIAHGPGTLGISHNVCMPRIEPDMVLVKNAAVALNPADAKMVDFSSTTGAIAGYDFAGTVIAIGSAVTKPLGIGDRVCGNVHGMNSMNPEVGAFAQYIGATGDILLKIPDSMSFETAASFGTGVATAGLALFQSMRIPISPDNAAEKPFWVLVYGGSTATGTIAIQLLKLSGLRPLTTCSPKNFALVKSYGAEEAFDYKSPTCATDIRAYTKNTLSYALDCITEANTMQICYAAIGRAGGRYTGLEPYPELQHTRKAVKPDWVMALTIYGKKVALDGVYGRDACPEDRIFGRKWFATVQKLLDQGKLRSHPIKIGSGAFEGVLEGVDQMRKRTISGEKLVYRVG
ncbi:hypothetical protein MMC19_000659 [Ptychographa xylographoides]|nr:hypothetical protein [Ptychographa xylographoides]